MGALDDYLATLDGADRDVLSGIRDRAIEIVPDAEQGMSYGMAALRYRGRPLISVRATAKHLSVFPFSPEAVEAVAGALAGYSLSKGTIRFSAEKPLPDDVVTRLVIARRDEIDQALGDAPAR
ncbi:iron chaperone [Leifsonia flava]|uniref:DUF1801 domain-containing protein n=1 Tax=Orlajensenia leifsoniae TaxID=2561933 RepID=A0A4Y9QWP4_9MICO|nr:DUF1801 domain-containing protein [Leifsonia flava]TFV96647.1 DUF1801 domain-containing protein [Leifsonia flava]